MKRAIVVGSGAGGATAAKELQGKFEVTVLEAGREFSPFTANLALVEKARRAGLLIDEREIQIIFPAMRIRKTKDRIVMVNGIGLGGTTTLAAGNGVRMDESLKACGIDLEAEFEELYREIPVTTDHQRRWRPATRRLFDICTEMNLNPRPLPKMGDNRKCTNCGHCILGCASGAKWDSRRFLDIAKAKGARVRTGCRVEEVVIEGGRAVGVRAKTNMRSEFIAADLVVLAAGGFGTPPILEKSGIECERRLFVDPVLCVAGEWKGALQNKEISMPFVAQRDGYILSPYFDYLSYFFNRNWRLPANDTLVMMIKLADANSGTVCGRRIDKALTGDDRATLARGVSECREIFSRMGLAESTIVLGTINAGHPGGMLPLTAEDAETLHSGRLPRNLYVADATVLPTSLGNPPIFTIMALAKRISTLCLSN